MDEIVTWAAEKLAQPILRTEELQPPDRRSRVLRCFTENGTVVLKQAPDAREIDGLALLAGSGLAPAIRAGDASRGLVLMEDLPGERLDVCLLRDGPSDVAARLVQYAETLGRLHALPVDPGPQMSLPLDRICQAWEIRVSPADRAALVLEATAYTQGDVGPDNAMVVDDGVVLFDFEIGGVRHPLTDAVAWHMGFPFGAGTGALPDPIIRAMDAAYESALGITYDIGAWGSAYIFQLLGRLDRFHRWDVLDDDWSWGRATGRQRILALLDSRPPEAPLEAGLDQLAKRLQSLWPGTPTALPPFPALRNA